MGQRDYLSAFAEANRSICEGADERIVMNLITKRVTETLDLKGCMIKLNPAAIERMEYKSDAIRLGGSPLRSQSLEAERLELLSSYGLSQNFIYSGIHGLSDSQFSQSPQKTVAVADIEKTEENVDYNVLRVEGIRAFLMFPIEVNGEDVALVALFDDKLGALSSEDVKFARAITSRGVASCVRLRRWNRMLDRERQFLRCFQEISSAIGSTLTINKVLQLVVTTITEVLGVRGTQVRLLDRKTNELQLAASFGLSEKFTKIGALKTKRGEDGVRKLSTKAIVIDDAPNDPRLQYRAEIAEEGIRKILTLPLIARDRMIGELTIFTGESLAFTEREIQFTTAIALQCACAIENSRMYQQVKYEFHRLLEDFGYEGS
ncbi:MAG: GAF domain-containing protein [Syntrophobacteraceae bacterium]|nr:GAF domain-containing protein [Syntrophobacteraceae bacterium]